MPAPARQDGHRSHAAVGLAGVALSGWPDQAEVMAETRVQDVPERNRFEATVGEELCGVGA